MDFRGVIDLWSNCVVMANDIDEKPATVQKWRQRNRIPGDCWLAIVSAAEKRGYDVTLEQLAAIASEREASAA